MNNYVSKDVSNECIWKKLHGYIRYTKNINVNYIKLCTPLTNIIKQLKKTCVLAYKNVIKDLTD